MNVMFVMLDADGSDGGLLDWWLLRGCPRVGQNESNGAGRNEMSFVTRTDARI